VKLLFDENLSPRLVEKLAADYPGSLHVRSVELRGKEDAASRMAISGQCRD